MVVTLFSGRLPMVTGVSRCRQTHASDWQEMRLLEASYPDAVAMDKHLLSGVRKPSGAPSPMLLQQHSVVIV